VNAHADLPSSEYEKMDLYTLIIGGFSENNRIESKKWMKEKSFIFECAFGFTLFNPRGVLRGNDRNTEIFLHFE